MGKKVFRSRISLVLAGVVLAIFILITVPLFRYGGYVAVIIIIGLWLLWFLNMIAGFRYEIADDKLYLKLWAMTFLSVNIMDIASVRRSYNPRSSPAASLKRLCLRFRKKSKHSYCLVSPVREQEFLDTLKSINPDIDIQLPEKQRKWRLSHLWDWDI
jgi:hypothetical protein